MSLEIRTEIIINSTPKNVWHILLNTKEYPNWNPFIKSLEGDLKVGNSIKVTIQPEGSKTMNFKPKIKTLIPQVELSWIGNLILPGIFDGLHKFEIIHNNNDTVTFIQSEIFSGVLVPLFKNQLLKNTKQGFCAMNDRIKLKAEA